MSDLNLNPNYKGKLSTVIYVVDVAPRVLFTVEWESPFQRAIIEEMYEVSDIYVAICFIYKLN